MNKHAMKRITFDKQDVFIDTFGRKSRCLVSYLDSVCFFWVVGVIFEKMLTTFGRQKLHI